MKRSKPLARRTPLKATAQLARKTRLSFRSKKTAEVYRTERRPLVECLLRERPECEIGGIIRSADLSYRGCTGKSVDVNEVVPRGRGGSITDESNCVTTCRICHGWLGDNVAKATELGLIKHSWER